MSIAAINHGIQWIDKTILNTTREHSNPMNVY